MNHGNILYETRLPWLMTFVVPILTGVFMYVGTHSYGWAIGACAYFFTAHSIFGCTKMIVGQEYFQVIYILKPFSQTFKFEKNKILTIAFSEVVVSGSNRVFFVETFEGAERKKHSFSHTLRWRSIDKLIGVLTNEGYNAYRYP